MMTICSTSNRISFRWWIFQKEFDSNHITFFIRKKSERQLDPQFGEPHQFYLHWKWCRRVMILYPKYTQSCTLFDQSTSWAQNYRNSFHSIGIIHQLGEPLVCECVLLVRQIIWMRVVLNGIPSFFPAFRIFFVSTVSSSGVLFYWSRFNRDATTVESLQCT